MSYTPEEDRPGPENVVLNGVNLIRGSRVRLHPRSGGDIMDLVLAEKVAIIEAFEVDFEGVVHASVIIEDDPGRDLGMDRQPGHRFFFSLAEIEPLDDMVCPEEPAWLSQMSVSKDPWLTIRTDSQGRTEGE